MSTVEAARLDALRSLQLSGAGPDPSLDVFTRLATELVGVPIALVSLIDADSQRFLSSCGLPPEAADRGAVPISESFCRHTVLAAEPLVVADGREDKRITGSPAARELEIVAYAGFPLVLANGEAVGSLCAIDHQPRGWTARELSLLEDLASAVCRVLDLRADLVHRSLHDRLTGLPNRDLLVASCGRTVGELGAGEQVAVICAGVDHFTLVNQAFGTENADAALQAVARRLAAIAEDDDVFGRLRGDTFVLITRRPRDEEQIYALAEEFHAALASGPLQIAGEPLSLHVTVGVASGGREANGADLISQSSNAMRQAKRQQGRVRIARDSWTEAAAQQLRLRDALRGALEREEVSVVYQPVRELSSGTMVALEALARWHHPELGDVSPAEFIPLAELTGDILRIGEFVLEQAAGLVARLRAAGAAEMRIGVNASPVQLEQPHFAERVAKILADAGVDGSAIGIEITEGTLLESGEAQASNLRRLRETDVHVVLDDFGTGYSALGYLREFPVQTVKIDRSFVKDLEGDQVGLALVRAILAMADGLDLFVVAEGIETEAQERLLRGLGCEFGQGFGLGRPAPAETALAEVAARS